MGRELQSKSPMPIKESFLYRGRGWDVGSYVYSARKLERYDLVLFMNSQARFKTESALEKILQAWTELPSGMIGLSSSFEVTPHVRTSAFGIPPKLLLEHASNVRSRYEACVFEHSPSSITSGLSAKGLPVRIVYSSGSRLLSNSRDIPGVFRSDQQQELLVSDRHTRLFDLANPEERVALENRANNLPPVGFRFRSKYITWLL